MAVRPGGFSLLDLEQGWQTFLALRNIDELARALDEFPVLSDPGFQHRIKAAHGRDWKNSDAASLSFRSLCQDYFRQLHMRAYVQLFDSWKPASQVAYTADELYGPAYFHSLLAILGGNLPDDEGPCWLPSQAGPSIQQELESLLGHHVDMPPYQPSPGSLWTALVVVCLGCKQRRLDVRAHYIDLTQEPSLIPHLRACRINNARCLACDCPYALPVRIWIQEPPASIHGFDDLTSLWKFADKSLVYQPPAGTKRDPQSDAVLEARAFELAEFHSAIPTCPDDSTSAFVVVIHIAYSIEELIYYHNQSVPTTTDAVLTEIAPEDRPPDSQEGHTSELPGHFRTLVREISDKLRSGIMPLAAGIEQLRVFVRLLGGDRPITVTDFIPQGGQHAHDDLAFAILSEECAVVGNQPLWVRAVLACDTFRALFGLSEYGLAETALARAEDHLSRVATDDIYRTRALDCCRSAQLLWLSHCGKNEEAYSIATDLAKNAFSPTGDMIDRLEELRTRAAVALAAQKIDRYAEALKIYPGIVANWQRLEFKVAQQINRDADTPQARAQLANIQESLSAELANWGCVFSTLADDLEAWELANPGVASDQAGDSLPEAVQGAMRVLQPRYFPGELTSGVLRERSRVLLSGALSISTNIGSWKFAGIQANKLAYVLHSLGLLEQAGDMMQAALGYAEKAGDHGILCDSRTYFVAAALQAEDGAGALAHARAAAREEMRRLISLGYRGTSGDTAARISLQALVAATVHNGDPLEAALIVESMKAIPLAVTLTQGLAGRELDELAAVDQGQWSQLQRQAEMLRCEAAGQGAVPEDAHRQLVAVEQQLSEWRRHLSLRDPRYAFWCDATWLDLSDVQHFRDSLQRLGPGTRFLGVHMQRDLIWSYLIDSEGCSLGCSGLRGYEDGLPDLDNDVDALADIILGPHAESLLHMLPSERLLVSLDESLMNIPVAALPLAGTLLCQRATLTHVPGTGALEALLWRGNVAVQSVLCLANPFRADGCSLPGAEAEADSIAHVVQCRQRQATILRGSAATIRALREVCPAHDVLHLACHAREDCTEQNLGRLLLARDEANQDSGDLTDRRISTELRLKPGCFVNLAGCATGLRHDSSNYIARGLVYSFLSAGAGAVLAYARPMPDRLSADFQTEFYRCLLELGSPAAALACVQRACCSGELGPELEDRSVWASYVSYGVS